MTAGQLSAYHKRKTYRTWNLGTSKECYDKVAKYAEQENIYMTQAMEIIIDAFFTDPG